jgi:hypothetical protein
MASVGSGNAALAAEFVTLSCEQGTVHYPNELMSIYDTLAEPQAQDGEVKCSATSQSLASSRLIVLKI